MSVEDEMVSALIGMDEPNQPAEDELADEVEYTIEPEAHYNHYGNRGVVDLFTREERLKDGRVIHTADAVYEVKSDAAVRSATGANEIIRQFNKHRKYFYKDDTTRQPTDIRFELVFVPTELTVKHVIDNAELYHATGQNMFFPNERGYIEQITFRTPEEGHAPVRAFSNKFPDMRNPDEMIDAPLIESVGHCPSKVRSILREIV